MAGATKPKSGYNNQMGKDRCRYNYFVYIMEFGGESVKLGVCLCKWS